MSAEFIDSNVFIYLFDDVAIAKRRAATDLIQSGLQSGRATISHQVVQETLNVIIGKLPDPATTDQARRFLDAVLLPMWRIMPSRELYHRGLDVQARYLYGYYDALIIAAALGAGCTRLYSEDFQDGQQIGGLTIVNPF
jgi:predicted nucleic acid-binding protein